MFRATLPHPKLRAAEPNETAGAYKFWDKMGALKVTHENGDIVIEVGTTDTTLDDLLVGTSKAYTVTFEDPDFNLQQYFVDVYLPQLADAHLASLVIGATEVGFEQLKLACAIRLNRMLARTQGNVQVRRFVGEAGIAGSFVSAGGVVVAGAMVLYGLYLLAEKHGAMCETHKDVGGAVVVQCQGGLSRWDALMKRLPWRMRAET